MFAKEIQKRNGTHAGKNVPEKKILRNPGGRSYFSN
jgi:hypothetical protein